MQSKPLFFVLLVGIIFTFSLSSLYAQRNVDFIRVSPQATVSQAVGFANVSIDYSRPGVKGRTIYGELVPYGLAPNAFGNGKPMPWRAGANENTTITLSHDAKVNGNALKAGKYSLHMLVHEDEWTVIFNNDTDAWGSFFYEESNDALRFKVKPQTAHMVEWLMYGFENLTLGACDTYLHWGELKVVFTIEFDQHNVTLDHYRKQLTNLQGFNEGAFRGAAQYCANNNVNLEEGLRWIDKALSMNNGQNFNNVAAKAGLLTKLGKKDEADKLIESSIQTATEVEINAYGYQLMVQQNNLDEAIKIFTLNVKRFPDSWNVYDSLGEALNNKGDKAGAKKNYEIAYENAPQNQKARIEGIIKGL
jgi:tetratricopeptide (TPR) repeat protein